MLIIIVKKRTVERVRHINLDIPSRIYDDLFIIYIKLTFRLFSLY